MRCGTPTQRAGETRSSKLEAAYVAGQRNGDKRSWHPNGRLRAVFVYEQGTLVKASAWSVAGAPLDEAAARALAARDAEADERYYESLEAIVNAHPPRCDEAVTPPRSANAGGIRPPT